jgi:hypothetical protein
MEFEISHSNIDLNEQGMCSHVLIQLFLDATRKFGRLKEIKSMDYNCVGGLTVVDADDVVWSLEVNAKVRFPTSLDNLPNSRVQDSDAKMFCPECNAGMAQEAKMCSYCEYLKRI